MNVVRSVKRNILKGVLIANKLNRVNKFTNKLRRKSMKASLESIKIEMTYEDGKQLKEQLFAMINDIRGMSEAFGGYFDEAKLRETYPKVNEFLQVINVRDELPF